MQQRTNPFAYPKPITLDSLGDLFDHHRGLSAGWSMTATPPEPGPPTPPAPPTPTPPAPSPYTPPQSQADLDRIVGERVARERAKYADYADVKTKAEAHDAALEAAKTESEKAVEAARKEGESTATERSNARIVAADARALAASWSRETDGVESKFNVGPASIVRLLDLSGVTVGDDGADATVIKAKLDELATSEPGLVGSTTPPRKGPRPDPSQGGGGREDAPSVSRGRDIFEARRAKKTA